MRGYPNGPPGTLTARGGGGGARREPLVRLVGAVVAARPVDELALGPVHVVEHHLLPAGVVGV